MKGGKILYKTEVENGEKKRPFKDIIKGKLMEK